MVCSTYRLEFNPNASPDIRVSLSAVCQVGSHLWLGCDETATLERLTWHGAEAKDHLNFQVSDFLDLPNSADEEIDIEGIAYSDYYLWFVGSHSLKRKLVRPDKTIEDNIKRLRKVEREENRYTLGRIPLVEGKLLSACSHPERPGEMLTAAQLKRKKKISELTHRLEEDVHLGDFLKVDIPGKDNGFNIEGMALCDGHVLLGLRGPVLRGWAVLLELALEDEAPDVLRMQKLGDDKERYRKHFLDLGGLGIRDLCLRQEQLLILAGPTMALDGSLRVFTLPLSDLKASEGMLRPSVFLEVPYGKGCDRAEGFTLIGPDQAEILVVYDTPAAERLTGDNAVLADRIPL